jgi:hypothetical protein
MTTSSKDLPEDLVRFRDTYMELFGLYRRSQARGSSFRRNQSGISQAIGELTARTLSIPMWS